MEDVGKKRESLLKFIQANGSASISQLCQAFDISESTARRMLSALDKEKLVKRFHGGAMMLRDQIPEPAITRRTQTLIEEKTAIGRAAAALVQDGDTLLLAGGSTVAAICPYLKGRNNLKVITDSVLVLQKLLYLEDIQVIFLGGVLNRAEQLMEGHLTMMELDKLHADKLFMGVRGIDINRGLMTDDMGRIQLTQALFKSADERIIVADHTKFLQTGLAVLALFNDIDCVITDSNASRSITEALEKRGVDVKLCDFPTPED